MKKIKLTNLDKLSKQKLAKISGGNAPEICLGCLCSGGIELCTSEDAKAAQKSGHQ